MQCTVINTLEKYISQAQTGKMKKLTTSIKIYLRYKTQAYEVLKSYVPTKVFLLPVLIFLTLPQFLHHTVFASFFFKATASNVFFGTARAVRHPLEIFQGGTKK